jgi:signal transduction histidine kinase
MGSHDEALRWYSKAIPLRQAAQDQSGLATTYQQLGLLWGKMRQFDSARVYIELGINTSNALNMREITIQGYLNRAAIDSMQGNFAAAFAHYKQGIALKDSLYSLELIQQLDELQTRYDMKTKEQQILTLQRDKAEQSATRTKLLAGLGGLVLLALVVVAGYIRTRNKNIQLQTANAEIIRQRDILEEQAGEIELANSALNEKNLALERQQEILATQSREIELVNTALNENNQTLTQLNAEKNEFLGIAAHDLKSPLTGIMMSAAHLRLYYDRLSTDDRNHTLRRIEHVATVMNTIIENLLDINAIESGQLKVKSIPQSINALVATVIEHLTPNAAAKDINILTDLPERKLLVNIDGALATQVLQNLLSNAIKYSPLGKQVIVRVEEKYEGGSIKYENKYENRDGNNTNTPSLIPQHLSFLRVLVQDEGPGISADDQAKLFSKFTRLSAMPTAGEHSTGLGLSIVKRLVEAMQGRVWCESELGRGATFIVEFPLANELP